MILTTSNDTSQKFNSSHARLLKDECDDVKTFTECGWFCVIGYKGDKRLVYAHCDNREQYEIGMGILKSGGPFGGGASGYLHQAAALYFVDGEVSGREEAFFSSSTPYLSNEQEAELVAANFREPGENETRQFRFRDVYWDDLPRGQSAIPADDEEPSRDYGY